MQIDRPGKETERERHLSADEIRTAWAAFDSLGYPWGSLFKVLLVTGQRRGEVAGMKWSEITPDGWRLPGERAKKGKGHLVPLSTLAREILDGVPEIGELVFRSRTRRPASGLEQSGEAASQATWPDGAVAPARFATDLRHAHCAPWASTAWLSASCSTMPRAA